MRRKVQLYIAGRQVDLGDDSFILYNWTREDLSNPTSVVNSSSHQVELPGTHRNNSVFGSVFRLDRRTLFGSRYDGADFDPTRKTPFMLYDADGSVLESGYCRLDEVNTHSHRHAYTLTLYGGLGSFFYALSSSDDGTPRTLADLIYAGMDGADVSDFTMQPRAEFVQEAWEYLADGYDPDGAYFARFWNIVNFAPAYNGLPDDFDASHAIGRGRDVGYNNIPAGYTTDDGVYYSYKAGLDCALLSFSNPHAEWELCDLRWYLQRPAISVKAFIAAVCDPRNNGGYDVELDETFFTDDNPSYAEAWWTLTMIASADRENDACITNVLKASKTPMQYLVDYCKIFGLLFLWDSARHKVSIVTRATFYADTDAIDLSERIDRSHPITQDPALADSRWYQLGDGGKGEFVEQYAQDYGRGYAVQRIDTAYEFDTGTKILTEGSAFQDGAEVAESDRLFASAYGLEGWGVEDIFLPPRYEDVTIELWNGNDSMMVPVRFYNWYSNRMPTIEYDSAASPGMDWLPKLQAHAAEGKAQAGNDVLLYFAGIKDTPTYANGVHKTYYLTADDPAMLDLNGEACWDVRRSGIAYTSLPSFRRVWLSGRYITESFEWGVPAVRPVLDIDYPTGKPTTVFARWWKAYLRDRYNVDTRVLTARVNLRGLQVGQELLRRFYWYDNALWVLNAIRNHPLTSWDLTECEFVKVQDKRAYTQGPGAGLTQYLIISPDASSFAMSPSGESLTLEVKSSSNWALALDTIVSWLTVSASSGSAGTSALTFTVPSNTTTGRRQVTVTLTNTEGEMLSFNITQAYKQAQSISLSPSSITIPASGTAIEGVATRGHSSRVTADGAWDVDSDTVPSWLTVIKSTVGLTLQAGSNSGSERTASIKVYLTGDTSVYATLSVVQEAGAGGTGGITLLDGNGNDSATVQSEGGSLTLYLTVPDAAAWTLSKSASWVSLSPVSGSDNKTIAVTVPAYTGSSDRSTTITAVRDGYTEGAVFYLYQAAPAAASDYIDLTRADAPLYNDIEIDGNGGTNPFDVLASGAWTVVSQSSWIHPETQYGAWSGSGNRTLWFTADPNTGAARTGRIVGTHAVTGDTSTFYVYQSGDGTITLDASFNKSSIDSSAQVLYLNIQATSGLAWTIDQISTGLSLSATSGTGSATITVNVTAASARRTLSCRVRNAAYGLSASPSVVQAAPAATNYLRVTPFGTFNVGASARTQTFRIESNTAWQVRLTSGQGDVTISPATGSGNATVTVSFNANNTTTARDIALTFETTSGTTITVTATVHQFGASSATLEVSPTSVSLPGNGTAATVLVSASGTWTASKSASWITTSVPNSGTLTIGASVNNGSPRDGTVTVICGDKSVTIAVHQATTSALEVSKNTVALGADSGSEGAVTVYASGLWDISEYSDVPVWLEVVYPSHSGSENGETMTFRAKSANTTGSTRAATIRVALADNAEVYEDITVTQISASTLYATPTAITVGNAATTGFINVRSNTSWRITSFDEGLTIASAAQSGTGNYDVMFAVTANPDEEVRRMRVYFATTDGTKTAMVTVIQEAAQATIAIEPDEALWFETSDDPDQSILVLTRKVIATKDWTAASSDSWLSFSPASGTAGETTVTLTARGSQTDILRATWTVTAGDKTKTLSARCTPILNEE